MSVALGDVVVANHGQTAVLTGRTSVWLEADASKASNDDSGVKGQYIIAKASDGKSNLTSDGSARGVEGFIE